MLKFLILLKKSPAALISLPKFLISLISLTKFLISLTLARHPPPTPGGGGYLSLPKSQLAYITTESSEISPMNQNHEEDSNLPLDAIFSKLN